MSDRSPLIEIAGVTKKYHGLRPLRLARLIVGPNDCLVLSGFDAAAAEVFVHLITGAALPDEGTVRVGGRDTQEISTDTEWLASLDRFGIVTDRSVLLEGLSAAANLALPLTIAIDPMTGETRMQVAALAGQVGLLPDRLDVPVSALSTEERVRIHLGRAVGVNPELLLLEHPTAKLDEAASTAIGQTLAAISASRPLGFVALTEDEAFARATGARRLKLNGSTGELAEASWSRRLAGRIFGGSRQS